MQNTAKQNYPGSVASYDARPGNEVGLFYNAPKPTRGIFHKRLTMWKPVYFMTIAIGVFGPT